MQETIDALEAKLAAVANAWQRALSAEAEISRLKRYRKMNAGMEADHLRHCQRLADARLELSSLLNVVLIPSEKQIAASSAPSTDGAVYPCTQTGD